MRHKLFPLLWVSFIIVSGCTSTSVKPVHASAKVSHICIKENPYAEVKDFTPIIQNGFSRHGITTEVSQTGQSLSNSNCNHTLTYTAQRIWDIAYYMSHSELFLHDKSGEEIGSAMYHLKGGGGLALTKYKSTKGKMDPVIDELLQHYPLSEDKDAQSKDTKLALADQGKSILESQVLTEYTKK